MTIIKLMNLMMILIIKIKVKRIIIILTERMLSYRCMRVLVMHCKLEDITTFLPNNSKSP